jgi:hypothetical protein
MEVDGRPDGSKPGGYPTCLDWLHAVATEEGEAFALDEKRCLEIDREFVQFFHRRVAWLALREFPRAVADADHTLALMDFSSLHSPDVDWSEMHEQYRPFVLFHRTQAAALGALERDGGESAVAAVEAGIASIRAAIALEEDDPEFDEDEEDELIEKLSEMKLAITEHYEVETPLTQRLADAIAAEQYELAAQLRDQLGKRKKGN